MSFYQVGLKAQIDVIFLFDLLFAWSAFPALGQFPFTRSWSWDSQSPLPTSLVICL